MRRACPICGAVGMTCHEAAYLPPVEFPPLEFKEVVKMPPVAKEQAGKPRFPQQYVRPGRGVAGYKGEVETYVVPRGRAAFETQPAADPNALEGKTRAELDDIAEQLGLVPADYGNKGKIIDAINEKREE